MADEFELDTDDLQRRMDGAMANLRTEFASLRTGRASASMLELVQVEAYGTMTPVNQVGRSDRKGVEVSADLAVTDRFDVGLSYTWLDASNPDGTVEVRRPEHEALLQLGYRMPNDRTRINLDLRHVAGNHDSDFTSPAFGARTVRLSDYTLVNLRLSHDITDSTRLTAGIYNLTDARYEELDGYATQGRTVFFGATSRF